MKRSEHTFDPSALDDAELVRRVVAGGPGFREAYDELVERTHPAMIRYATHLLHNRDDAADVVQEVFVHAFFGLRTLRDVRRWRGWIRSMVTRAAFNHQRAGTRRRFYESQQEPVSRFPLPGARLEATEVVVQVMAQLPYPYREILVLRHVEALSVGEIAGILEISPSAAKMRLFRAREQFTALYDRLVPHAK